MRLAAVAICLLIAGAASPGNASAAEHGFHRVTRARTPEPVLTDGARWVAYRIGRRTHVVDERRGSSYTVATPPKCELAAVGHGLLMWQCHTPPARYYDRPDHPALFDLVRRRRIPVAGFDALESDFDAQTAGSPTEEQGSYTFIFSNVGREWLGGMYDISRGVSHDVFGVFALNWHTGERRYDRPRKATEWPNFDSPGFGQPLCSPLRRAVDEDYFNTRVFVDFAYERGYGVTNNGSHNKLLLERCNGQPMLLDHCPGDGCADWQLGAGMVTWQRGSRVLLYDIARRRRRVFNPPRVRGYSSSAQHTRRTLFVSVADRVGWRLYARKL